MRRSSSELVGSQLITGVIDKRNTVRRKGGECGVAFGDCKITAALNPSGSVEIKNTKGVAGAVYKHHAVGRDGGEGRNGSGLSKPGADRGPSLREVGGGHCEPAIRVGGHDG